MSERFTKEASRWGYHGCDQCMSVDADTIETKGRLDQMWTDGESGETLCTECKERRENGRTEDEKLVSSSDIEAAYRAELDAATERNGNLCVQLAAMTLERDKAWRDLGIASEMIDVQRAESLALMDENAALRREVDALVGLCASNIDCGECPVDSSPTCMANPNECVKNIRDWAKQQAAQAGKSNTKNEGELP